MSATQAVQRAVDAVLANPRIGSTQDIVVTTLTAALEVEQLAQELHRLFGLDMPWVKLSQAEKMYYREKAAALRAAILGEMTE